MTNSMSLRPVIHQIRDLHNAGGRVRVAAACGYFDARTMVNLHQTHGYPLDICADKITAAGLRVDWSGLRDELQRIGKDNDSITSLFREMGYAGGAL